MRWLLLALSLPLCGQTYDLLLKGGTVLDAKNGINARRDVAILEGKVAAIAASIPATRARKTIDVAGLYVTPGLIDIHVHVFAGTANAALNNLSVFPDDFSFRSGVTTMVDAGTSGWRTFPEFKKAVVATSRTRVLAFLNIVGQGMTGRSEQDLTDMDPKAAADMAMANKDVIVGFKTAHYSGPEWTPVENAVKAGELAGMPAMVDFGDFRPERPFQELVLQKLRPGDIYTHQYLSFIPMFDAQGKIEPYLLQAKKRGVLFDVGHGNGSFLFRLAAPAIQQGFPPDSISTDMHHRSLTAGMKDMLNVMSKFLNMGMPLDEVVQRSSWNPAREIHHEELGNLSVGSPADIAVLRVDRGEFGFVDAYGARLKGTRKLEAEITLRAGRVMWDVNGRTRNDWQKLPKDYLAQGEDAWDGTLSPVLRKRKQ